MNDSFVQTCREVGTEGILLLKNDDNVLPLAIGTKISLFGRIQTNYIKSGTGSGGLVNVEHVVGIPEGLESAGLCLNQELATIYREWEKENPFDEEHEVNQWIEVSYTLRADVSNGHYVFFNMDNGGEELADTGATIYIDNVKLTAPM